MDVDNLNIKIVQLVDQFTPIVNDFYGMVFYKIMLKYSNLCFHDNYLKLVYFNDQNKLQTIRAAATRTAATTKKWSQISSKTSVW